MTGRTSRAVKTHIPKQSKNAVRIFRIFLMVSLFINFAASTPTKAIETTKASALVLEDMRAGAVPSFQKAPPQFKADPCLPLLHATSLPNGSPALDQSRRPVGKSAAPVALGLFLGVRIALGPKEVVKPSQRVQVGPEIRAASTQQDRGSRALAIAAYRSCKNDHVLKLHNKNKKKAGRNM